MLTQQVALYARNGGVGADLQTVDAPWFPIWRTLSKGQPSRPHFLMASASRCALVLCQTHADDQLVLHIAASGICGNDLHVTSDLLTFAFKPVQCWAISLPTRFCAGGGHNRPAHRRTSFGQPDLWLRPLCVLSER